MLLFATLFSCMRQEKPLPAELSRAESVMWEHPDSALSILRSMPQSSLSSGKNYATWALLLAQARDKVYGKRLPDSLNIPSSDKLVQDAMDYFEKEDDLKRMAQAYYYKGQLLEDQKKLTEAIPLFLKSKDIMTRLDEPLFTYLICQSLGNTYRYQDLYEESLVQLKDAYQYALRSGNGERISYALSELGRTYVHINEMDSALFYFGKSLENAKRLGINIIQTEVHDATKLKEDYVERFDKILLDVPCLGLGVIRRKPDIKWNRQENNIKEISDIQFNILKTCSKYLKKNGTLVYSTCSMLKEENDAIIEKFIKDENFEIVDIDKQIPKEFSKITTNNMVQFLPSQKHDGFFITMLKKI